MLFCLVNVLLGFCLDSSSVLMMMLLFCVSRCGLFISLVVLSYDIVLRRTFKPLELLFCYCCCRPLQFVLTSIVTTPLLSVVCTRSHCHHCCHSPITLTEIIFVFSFKLILFVFRIQHIMTLPLYTWMISTYIHLTCHK